MALRRRLGSRRSPGPPRPRPFGPEYLVQHACFACRKGYKVVPRDDGRPTCPNCGGEMHEMGRAFRAPKRKDAEQWVKVQALYAHGFRFSRYGGEYEPLPSRLRDVGAFVERNPDHPLRT